MPLRTFVAQIALKLGTGTQTPAGTDCISAVDASYEHDVTLFDREDITGNMMKFTGIPGQRMGRIKFSCYLKGQGAAGSAPEMGDAFQACRLNQALVAVTSATYKALVAETSVATVTYNQDGTQFKITDALGDIEIAGDVGKPYIATFTFTGAMVDPADVALLTPTYDTTIPPIVMGSTITLDGITTNIAASINWKLGNEITMRDSIAAASGYAGAFHSNRRTTGSFVIEMPTVAADDLWTMLKTPTTGTFSNSAIGAAGNLVQITASVGSYTKLTPGKKNGLATIEGEFLCGRAAATAEGADFQIIFT